MNKLLAASFFIVAMFLCTITACSQANGTETHLQVSLSMAFQGCSKILMMSVPMARMRASA